MVALVPELANLSSVVSSQTWSNISSCALTKSCHLVSWIPLFKHTLLLQWSCLWCGLSHLNAATNIFTTAPQHWWKYWNCWNLNDILPEIKINWMRFLGDQRSQWTILASIEDHEHTMWPLALTRGTPIFLLSTEHCYVPFMAQLWNCMKATIW